MLGKLTKAIEGLTRALCERRNDDTLRQINERLGTLMATQIETATELRAANAQLKKLVADTAGIQGAVDALKAKIVELEELLASGNATSQELADAVAETKTLAQAVDDNVPELTPPVEPPVA